MTTNSPTTDVVIVKCVTLVPVLGRRKRALLRIYADRFANGPCYEFDGHQLLRLAELARETQTRLGQAT